MMGPFLCAFLMISISSIISLFKRDWVFFCKGLSAATSHMFFQCCEFTCKALLSETENVAMNRACVIFSIVGACYGFLMGSELLSVFIVSWCLLTSDKTSMTADVFSIASCLPKGISDSWFRQYALYPGTAIGMIASYLCFTVLKMRISGNVMFRSQLIQKCLILTSLHIVIFLMLELCRSSTNSVASLFYGISFGIGITFGLMFGRPVLQLSLRSLYPYRYYSWIPLLLLGAIHASNFSGIEISFFKQLLLLPDFNSYYVCSLLTMVELIELYKAILNPKRVKEANQIMAKKEEP